MRALRRVVIAGYGLTGAAVHAGLGADAWEVVVVDRDPARLEAAQAAGARVVEGDATSRLVLEDAGLTARSALVAATGDDRINFEILRLGRDTFGVEERLAVLGERPDDDRVAAAEVVVRASAVAARLLNRLGAGRAAGGADIGLGRGEIVQVTVLDGSVAIGRPLRELGARTWLLAAVYRDDALIVPHGDTAVAVGDRVVLVGEPPVVADVARYFRGGDPVFPTQYGRRVGWHGANAAAGARWLAEVTRTPEPVPVDAAWMDAARTPAAERRACLDGAGIGCLVVDAEPVPWLERAGVVRAQHHDVLVSVRRPVLVLRPGGGGTRVLLAITDAAAQRDVALAAFDLARLLRGPLVAVVVRPPALGVEDDARVSGTPEALRALARLHAIDLEVRVLEGNPVQRIREAAKDADVAVLGLRASHHRFTSPDVSLFLLHALPCSAVFVPWGSARP